MGTKAADPESEVKQLKDLPFQCFTTPPPLDYLDVCDLRCQSSTGDSQISADDDSTASTWYAELNVSGQSESDEDGQLCLEDFHDDNDHDSESLKSGGFECVDVALESRERAERGEGPKMVPKRQIQLRRCSTEECLATASGGVPAEESLPSQGHPKAMLCRQYSTPATIEGRLDRASLDSPPGNRKQRLKKSQSLDETSSRTKMASSLIKNVLSKKMQVELRIQQQKPEESDLSQPRPIKETPKPRVSNIHLSWSLKSPSRQVEINPWGGSVHQYGSSKTKIPQKVLDDHSLGALHSYEGRAVKSQKEDTGKSHPQLEQLLDGRTGEGEKFIGDSVKTSLRNTASMQVSAAGQTGWECQAPPENGKRQSNGSHVPSESPERALVPFATEGRKGTSNTSMKNLDISQGEEAIRSLSDMVLEVRGMLGGVGKQGNREDGERGQMAAPLHRVRDVRKLVKSTYSSPFNFSSVTAERCLGNKTETPPQHLAQAPLTETRQISPLRVTSNYYEAKGTAPVTSCKETIAVPGILELGTPEVRVPPHLQKPMAKVMSTKEPIETTSYNQQVRGRMTAQSYQPRPKTPLMSSCNRQPEKPRGGSTVSAYQQQQTPTAVPIRLCLPTATSKPSYKLPRHDPTIRSTVDAPIGGMEGNFGQPPGRSHGHYLRPPMDIIQPRIKDSHHPPAQRALHHTLHTIYPATSFTDKIPAPMQPFVRPSCPAQPLLPQPKDVLYPQEHRTTRNHPDLPTPTQDKAKQGRSRSPHRLSQAYPCGQGGISTTFAPESGGQAAVTGKAPYPPSGSSGPVFGKNSRRLLLDPETGTCFYVDMPAQPRRKVLFDPESGQYMEVLVPPQALYPSTINSCPYPYIPGQRVYPTQYIPYSMICLPHGN